MAHTPTTTAARNSATTFATTAGEIARTMSDAALGKWLRYIGDERRDPNTVHLPAILDAIENAIRDEVAGRIAAQSASAASRN